MNERLSIIFTNDQVEIIHTRRFLKERITEKKFPVGTKIIAFAGIHCDSSGTLGEPDRASIDQWKWSKEKIIKIEVIREIMREQNYDILDAVDIGEAAKKAAMKAEDHDYGKARATIVQEMFDSIARDERPYVVVLFWCFSKKSELNTMLAQLGLLTVQCIKGERGEITDKRCWLLDVHQRNVLEKVVKDHKDHADKVIERLESRNVFLYGQQGTGKTILLIQIASMRVAHYMLHDKVKEVKVIVMVGKKDALTLLRWLKKALSDWLKTDGDVKWSGRVSIKSGNKTGENRWSKENEIQELIFDKGCLCENRDTNSCPCASIIITEHLKQHTSSERVIYLLDEVPALLSSSKGPGGESVIKADFSNLEVPPNVDLLMAVSPSMRDDKADPNNQALYFTIEEEQQPKSFLCQRLRTLHRQNRDISIFITMMKHHLSLTQKESCEVTLQPDRHDEIPNQDALPKGGKPKLVFCSKYPDGDDDCRALDIVMKNGWMKKDDHVVIIASDDYDQKRIKYVEEQLCKHWTNLQIWSAKVPTVGFGHRANRAAVSGYEANWMIFEVSDLSAFSPNDVEIFTRGRNGVVMIDYSGVSRAAHLALCHEMEHDTGVCEGINEDYCKKGAQYVDCYEVNVTEGKCADLTKEERKTKFEAILKVNEPDTREQDVNLCRSLLLKDRLLVIGGAVRGGIVNTTEVFGIDSATETLLGKFLKRIRAAVLRPKRNLDKFPKRIASAVCTTIGEC